MRAYHLSPGAGIAGLTLRDQLGSKQSRWRGSKHHREIRLKGSPSPPMSFPARRNP